jgi:hypothetical protein
MAQIHNIDGTTINYISQAPWSQAVNSQSFDLIAVHEKYRKHTWLSNVMTTAEWATLIGKRGSIVSITTTDPNDPNGDYITYYEAIVRNVTFSRHESLNIIGAKVEFLVRV